MKQQTKILLFAALGIGALLFLGKKSSETGAEGGSGEEMFTLPDGRQVPVSQLPSLGYVKYQGEWRHQSTLTTENMPEGVAPNSPQWLNILNTAIQTGGTLFNLGGELGSQIAQTIKSTAVDWTAKTVNVMVKYGYLSYTGTLNPNSVIEKVYSDQKIVISGNGQIVKIRLTKGSAVQKEATIDFVNKRLTGFSAGSIISGTGVVGYRNTNIDTITAMYGIGALKGKGSRAKNQYNREVDAYKYFVLNLDTGRIEAGYEYKGDAIDLANDYDNAKVVTLRQMKQMGIADPRPNWKYVEGIGSIYRYDHPKGLTHCFDGTYSDAHKGACSYHGGAHEIKLRKGSRDYTGKGNYVHYMPYRKAYKKEWAKQKRSSDRVITL